MEVFYQFSERRPVEQPHLIVIIDSALRQQLNSLPIISNACWEQVIKVTFKCEQAAGYFAEGLLFFSTEFSVEKYKY